MFTILLLITIFVLHKMGADEEAFTIMVFGGMFAVGLDYSIVNKVLEIAAEFAKNA